MKNAELYIEFEYESSVIEMFRNDLDMSTQWS